jgi:hypothetical protein
LKRALLLALALAACSPPAPPKPTEGAAQQAIMDKATKAYAKCIADGAASIALGDDPADRSATASSSPARRCATR